MVGLTIRAVDAGMLVVAQEEAVSALTFVAAHGVDADLLAAAVVVLTLVHVCQDGDTQTMVARQKRRYVGFRGKLVPEAGNVAGQTTLLSQMWTGAKCQPLVTFPLV